MAATPGELYARLASANHRGRGRRINDSRFTPRAAGEEPTIESRSSRSHQVHDHRVSTVLAAAAIFAVAMWLVAAPNLAEDRDAPAWGQWRGGERNGHAAVFGTLESWPAEAKVLWSVPVGEGQASPLLSGERAILFDRIGGAERLLVLDLETGETVWSSDDPVTFRPGMGGGRFGAGPKSTPAISGNRVVTYGVTSLLTTRELSSGRLLWQRDLAEEVEKATLMWGNSMSPIVVDGQVVIQFGNDKRGGIRSYDLETGEERWRVRGFGSSYASPMLVGSQAMPHLGLMGWGGPVGLSLEGEVLWQRPFKMSFFSQNTASPTFEGNMLFFSGEGRPLFGDRLRRNQQGWTVEPTWQRPDLSLDMASPVAFDERVCGITTKNRGQLFCVEAETGQDIFRGPKRGGDYAVLVVTPEHLLVLRPDGRLLVLDRTATEYSPLADYEIADSEVWAHPAVLPAGLVVRSKNRLTRLSFR